MNSLLGHQKTSLSSGIPATGADKSDRQHIPSKMVSAVSSAFARSANTELPLSTDVLIKKLLGTESESQHEKSNDEDITIRVRAHDRVVVPRQPAMKANTYNALGIKKPPDTSEEISWHYATNDPEEESQDIPTDTVKRTNIFRYGRNKPLSQTSAANLFPSFGKKTIPSPDYTHNLPSDVARMLAERNMVCSEKQVNQPQSKALSNAAGSQTLHTHDPWRIRRWGSSIGGTATKISFLSSDLSAVTPTPGPNTHLTMQGPTRQERNTLGLGTPFFETDEPLPESESVPLSFLSSANSYEVLPRPDIRSSLLQISMSPRTPITTPTSEPNTPVSVLTASKAKPENGDFDDAIFPLPFSDSRHTGRQVTFADDVSPQSSLRLLPCLTDQASVGHSINNASPVRCDRLLPGQNASALHKPASDVNHTSDSSTDMDNLAEMLTGIKVSVSSLRFPISYGVNILDHPWLRSN